MGYLKTTAMAVIAVAMVLVMAAKAQETQTCISKLADCAGSLNKTKPDQSCCTSIKDAVTTELPCLCNVFNTPGLLSSFGVTVEQALNLTKACGVPTDLSQCNCMSSFLILIDSSDSEFLPFGLGIFNYFAKFCVIEVIFMN